MNEAEKKAYAKLACDVVKLKAEVVEAKDDRRKMSNQVKRLFQEIAYVHSKQDKQHDLSMRRQDDTEERLERLKRTTNWIFGILLTTFLTVLLTAVIQLAMGQ